MLTKKIAIIILYFGDLNGKGYFQKFLSSCKKNPEVDWILYTDDSNSYDYPPNVHITVCRFEDIVERIRRGFEFDISLMTPYKLCDFKPAYGEIFYEDIKEYDWWGFSDIDILWGNISHFIDDSLLESYDQLYSRGHLTLMKNNTQMRELYRDSNGLKLYETIFSEEKHYAFDELHTAGGYREIVLRERIKLYDELDFADISKDNHFNAFNFELAQIELKVKERDKRFSVFMNTGDELKRIYWCQGEKMEHEYLYMHMQKRFIKDCCALNHDCYLIVPNRIIAVGAELTQLKQMWYHLSLSNVVFGGRMVFKKIYNKVHNRLLLMVLSRKNGGNTNV